MMDGMTDEEVKRQDFLIIDVSFVTDSRAGSSSGATTKRSLALGGPQDGESTGVEG